MKLQTQIQFCDDQGDKVFGEGPYRLLCAIRQSGSLRAAALDMGMAYTKAFNMLKRAEHSCGFPLCQRSIGGQGGGGSKLTAEAEELMSRYEEFRESCDSAIQALYSSHFMGFNPCKAEKISKSPTHRSVS